MAARRVGALVVIEDAMLIANAPAVAGMAFRQRLPSIGWPDYASAGGLVAYGIDFVNLFQRAATLVDRILKGARPADLPVERATKFDTIVNLKTAKAFGIDAPTSLLLRADEVIE
jgi:putative ABC transport system substrate-binding protein